MGYHKDVILSNFRELIKDIKEGKTEKDLYVKVQRMFVLDREFDLAMVYFIRNSTKTFLLKYRDHSLNELPIELASIVEENPKAKSLDDYIENILMKDNEDAQGFLLNIVPLVLRINIYIVNIDTSTNARVIFYANIFSKEKLKKLKLRNVNLTMKI